MKEITIQLTERQYEDLVISVDGYGTTIKSYITGCAYCDGYHIGKNRDQREIIKLRQDNQERI